MRIPAASRRSIARDASSVLDGKVTAVETDLDVIEQQTSRVLFADSQGGSQLWASRRQQPPHEEVDGFVCVLDRAVRLGLDVEVDHLAGGLPDARKRLGDADDVVRDGVPLVCLRGRHPRLVGERSRRDSAFDAGRQQCLEDGDEIQRVTDARLVAPVGRVHVRLHRSSVERAVWKTVDDRDVESLVVEKRAQLRKPGALQQFLCLARGDSQTEPERRRGRESGLERRRVLFQVSENGVPALRRMDIGAVSQVELTLARQPHSAVIWQSVRGPASCRWPARDGYGTSVTGSGTGPGSRTPAGGSAPPDGGGGASP